MISYFLFVVLAVIQDFPAHGSAQDAPVSAAQIAPDGELSNLERGLKLLDSARVAHAAGDTQAAQKDLAQALEAALELETLDAGLPVTELLADIGGLGKTLRDHRSAQIAWSRVLERRVATLPEEDPTVQDSRKALAIAHWNLGEVDTAETLFEINLDVQVRTCSEDDVELGKTRYNLGNLISQRKPKRAREVLEVAVSVGVRSGRDEDVGFQDVRTALAIACKMEGDVHAALALEEKVHEILTRKVPDDDQALIRARSNLAATLVDVGQLERARGLQERVLAIQSRSLPDDDLDLQSARQNLGITLLKQGEYARARALLEAVLQVRTRRLPDDHPAVQRARQNLSALMRDTGDYAGYQLLCEQVLEVQARTLPDEHPDLQAARFNLATALDAGGDHAAARLLFEHVYEVRTRTLPDDHHHLQLSRRNLSANYAMLGDHASARPLAEKFLEVSQRTLPDDHPDLRMARSRLADCLSLLGEHAAAKSLLLATVESETSTSAPEDLTLIVARQSLALVFQRLEDREGLARVSLELADRLQLAMTRAQAECSPRELEARAVFYASYVDTIVGIAGGSRTQAPIPELNRPLFTLIETMRGASSTAARFARHTRNDPEFGRLREDVKASSDAIARAARSAAGGETVQKAAMERDRAERALAQAAAESADVKNLVDTLTLESMTRHLGREDVLIGTWGAPSADDEAAAAKQIQGERHVFAFVARAKGDVSIVKLGPESKMETAVRAWRDSIGTSSAVRGIAPQPSAERSELEPGREVERLIVQPLRAAAGDATRWIVAFDGILNLLALDALPDGEGVLGDRVRIERHTALHELAWPTAPVAMEGRLVALGGVDFDAEPRLFERKPDEPDRVDPPVLVASAGATSQPSSTGWSVLRGTNFEQGFSPLAATISEAQGITELRHATHTANTGDVVLQGAFASRASIEALIPAAQYVHIATHGWFAPDAIHSNAQSTPLDARFSVVASSQNAQIVGLSPMALCGLALAGANRPANALGERSALATAEEISTWDLTQCELAVLSACDTNVGHLRGAGQGVASLQKALHMAGARSVITSLWKVPDAATKDLMIEFYRRIWVEKQPKHRALWEAKMKLRGAKDESGNALYATRDWAAWVLTGEPN